MIYDWHIRHEKAPGLDMYTRYPFDEFVLNVFLFWNIAVYTLHLAFFGFTVGCIGYHIRSNLNNDIDYSNSLDDESRRSRIHYGPLLRWRSLPMRVPNDRTLGTVCIIDMLNRTSSVDIEGFGIDSLMV
jgi:hypothetical protein